MPLLVPGVPLMSALLLGQTQILVFFLCLLAFERYIAGAFFAAGVALALAACLKITPAAFALIFLFDRNGRALAAFMVSGMVMLALSYAVAGPELHLTYLSHLRTISAYIYASFFAFSFETFLFEIWNAVRGTAPSAYRQRVHLRQTGLDLGDVDAGIANRDFCSLARDAAGGSSTANWARNFWALR